MKESDDQYEPDVDLESRYGAMKGCYGCGKTVDTDHDFHLVSRVWLFWKRYRCERCGKRHEKIGRKEMQEKWVTPQKPRERN
jgi:DNA-directed RNA polymerase subunit RPC12/RpoP